MKTGFYRVSLYRIVFGQKSLFVVFVLHGVSRIKVIAYYIISVQKGFIVSLLNLFA
jgi:hypothetical protein